MINDWNYNLIVVISYELQIFDGEKLIVFHTPNIWSAARALNISMK